MKHPWIVTLGICAAALPLHAEILNFDVSPAGSTAAVGLRPANEVPPASGTGSGGEIFSGITFDTDTNVLSVALGYGSFFGFTNLTGPATAAHIHGPAAPNVNAGVIHDFFLSGQHLFAPNPALGGTIVGSVILNPTQETQLTSGLLYVNIHTTLNPGGELRGQLILDANSPPTVDCPDSTTVECTSHDGTPVELVAGVEDLDGDELSVLWTIDGVNRPLIVVPSGGATTSAEVPFNEVLDLGVHTVVVTVSDGVDDPVSCEFTVTVVDTTPPVIKNIVANPSVLWPPNHKMNNVALRVVAEDICGDVTTEITAVSSNEPVNGTGDGDTSPDWLITGDHTLQLRAERSGNGSGRIYTITVTATDESGNTSTGTTAVNVPHSSGKKK